MIRYDQQDDQLLGGLDPYGTATKRRATTAAPAPTRATDTRPGTPVAAPTLGAAPVPPPTATGFHQPTAPAQTPRLAPAPVPPPTAKPNPLGSAPMRTGSQVLGEGGPAESAAATAAKARGATIGTQADDRVNVDGKDLRLYWTDAGVGEAPTPFYYDRAGQRRNARTHEAIGDEGISSSPEQVAMARRGSELAYSGGYHGVADNGGAPAASTANDSYRIPNTGGQRPAGGSGGSGAPARSGGSVVPTAPITGEEVPYAVNPTESRNAELISKLLERVSGALDAPSAYDDETFQASLDQGREYLNNDLAERGIFHSTAATDLFASRVMQPLQKERALSIANEKEARIRSALGLSDFVQGNERADRDEQRGERGYVDDLRNTAREQSIQEWLIEENARIQRENEFRQLLGIGSGYGAGGA